MHRVTPCKKERSRSRSSVRSARDLVLCSSSALAQKKKKGGAAPAARLRRQRWRRDRARRQRRSCEAAGPRRSCRSTAQAPAAGGDIELDQPHGPHRPRLAARHRPVRTAESAEASARSIRPPVRSRKTSRQRRTKTINAEVYAVQQIYVLRRSASRSSRTGRSRLNDQFVSHTGPGLALNYYITNVLAVGVNGTYYGRSTATRTSTSRTAARRASRVPLNDVPVARRPELHVRADVRKVRRRSATSSSTTTRTSSAASAASRTKPIRSSIPTTATSTTTSTSTSTSASASASSSIAGSPRTSRCATTSSSRRSRTRQVAATQAGSSKTRTPGTATRSSPTTSRLRSESASSCRSLEYRLPK